MLLYNWGVFTSVLFIMFSFFQQALQELKHVVWPTEKETRAYFTVTVGIMVSLGVFLFIVGQVFYSGIFAAKDVFGVRIAASTTATSQKSAADLQNIKTAPTASGTATSVPAQNTPSIVASGANGNVINLASPAQKTQLLDTLKNANSTK